MALEGSMSPNKGCTNNLLDCSIHCSLPCDRELKDQGIRSFEQVIQELRLKCENKDKRILELENEIVHVKNKLRENKENGDIKLLPSEVVPNVSTPTQSVESLLENIKDLKKALNLTKDPEALQKLIKVGI